MVWLELEVLLEDEELAAMVELIDGSDTMSRKLHYMKIERKERKRKSQMKRECKGKHLIQLTEGLQEGSAISNLCMKKLMYNYSNHLF